MALGEDIGDYGYLAEWRQGDYSLDVGGFLFGGPSTSGFAYDPEESIEGIVGLVLITQTCDIVRVTAQRYYVTVCPLIRLTEAEAKEVATGRRPYLASVENAQALVFADFRRPFSVSKDLLRGWVRQPGFSTEVKRTEFSFALERKFGQFAFPDEFDLAFKKFKDRVWSRHDKAESLPGKIYRSIDQIRFRISPNWEADDREVSVIVVLHPPELHQATMAEILHELATQFDNVALPPNYRWAFSKFLAQTAAYLTAKDILESQAGDFNFLCN